ncbi:MAG TPA: alpha/beta hydrolase domain-containing protein [Hyphomonadaceae bacterium]
MRLGRLAATALAVLTLGSTAFADVPNPKVTGPIPARVQPGDKSHDYPWMATIHPISQAGYVEEEFFFEGTARSYNTQGDNAMDGKVVSEGHPYRTRMIVRRPKDMKKFNGVVLAEWQNVTAGYDLDAMWGGSYEHIMREGYVWVGISAQFVGVDRAPNGLKVWSPVRYGALTVAAEGVAQDSMSYDIFAQGMEAIRDPQGVNVLGGATPKTVIAMGASQSAGRLGTYINALHDELGGPVSGYLLMIGGARVREDLNVPVFKLLSETDVPGQVRSRQPDTDKFRHWEIAGTSHSSRRTSMNAGPLTKRDHVERAAANCTYPTYPRVPMNYALAAVYDHMTAWAQKGVKPPIAPRLEVNGSEIVRDERGNAKGGIRLAEFDPAVALNSGANTGDGFCRLYGRYEPFDDATIAGLYPTHKAYADAAKKRVADNLAAGYIVKADADESRRRADEAIFGRNLKCAEACRAGQDLLDSTYFYLGGSDQLKKMTTRLAGIVRTIAGESSGWNTPSNQRAATELNKWLKDLRSMQEKGRLSQATVDELASGTDKVLAALN